MRVVLARDGAEREGVVGERGVLEDRVEDVEAEAVDARGEPVADDVEHRPLHRRVPVVEVGLEGEEARPVPLARGLVAVPAAPAQHRAPVVRRARRPRGRGPRARCRSHAWGSRASSATRGTTGAASERVVQHHVEDDLHPPGVDLADEALGVVERAVLGRDAEVVADVVAEVGLRALVEGGEPERLDAEPVQVVEPADDAPEVADAVAVRVGEGARIDLVDRRPLPPGNLGLSWCPLDPFPVPCSPGRKSSQPGEVRNPLRADGRGPERRFVEPETGKSRRLRRRAA